ncbi:MAG: hypothetical protein HGA19_24125 [Oscillochloris sp.]|nr:hypothetical protein [Oscillochloris sp.]
MAFEKLPALPHVRVTPMPSYHRLRFISVFGALIGLTLAGGLIPARPVAHAAQTSAAQAGLMVSFSDGTTHTACIDLGDDGEATGEEVLRKAGLTLITAYDASAGTAVCKIENTGCDYPTTSCFCQCTLAPGETCSYWAYYHLSDSGWAMSSLGAASYTVHSGEVEGWSWGSGGVESGVAPPSVTFSEICVPTATATATSTPTTAPTATATATLTIVPTATATPSLTPAPTSPPSTGAQPIVAPVASTTPRPTATTAPTRTPTATMSMPSEEPTAIASDVPTPTDTSEIQAIPESTPVIFEIPSATREVVAMSEVTTAPLEVPIPPEMIEAGSLAAGGAAASVTPDSGSVWLPLLIQALPTTIATIVTTIHVQATPTLMPTVSVERATRTALHNTGLFWFLAFSSTLALALVVVRSRKGV